MYHIIYVIGLCREPQKIVCSTAHTCNKLFDKMCSYTRFS